MSDQPTDAVATVSEGEPMPLDLKQVAKLLAKHFEIHEGLWDVALEFQVLIGQVGQSPDQRMPGALLGISRIGIVRSASTGPNTIDAAQENPA